MNQLGAIIGIVSGFLGIFGIVAKLAFNLGRLSERMGALEGIVEKNKEHDDRRIAELYASRNSASLAIVAMQKDVSQVLVVMDEVKTDLKEFMRSCREPRAAGV